MNTEIQNSLYKIHAPNNRIISYLLITSFIFLLFGLFLPLMTLKKWIFIENTLSIFSGFIRLFQEGHYFLCLIILIFSVIFPVCKIFILLCIWFLKWETKRIKKLLYLLGIFGKYSMLDVFVIALLVVMIRIRLIADIEIHFGIYVFSVSILLSIIAAHRIERIVTIFLAGENEIRLNENIIRNLKDEIVRLENIEMSVLYEDPNKNFFSQGYRKALNDFQKFLTELKT